MPTWQAGLIAGILGYKLVQSPFVWRSYAFTLYGACHQDGERPMCNFTSLQQ
jgi:hypothetical protein